MAEGGRPNVTRDTFFGGRLILHQPATGHRSGTDAVLLAAAVPRDFQGRAYDVGAGVGAVGLGIALACPGAQVTLVENDPSSVALAKENIVANGLEARVKLAACDVLAREARRAALPDIADLVVTNPPFYRADQVRPSPDLQRRAAHVTPPAQSLESWILACLDRLATGGTMIIIHQASAVPDLLRVVERRLGDVTLMPIHPRAAKPAIRVLLRGTKGSRAPFLLAPPLVLHEGDLFTDQTARIHRGEGVLVW